MYFEDELFAILKSHSFSARLWGQGGRSCKLMFWWRYRKPWYFLLENTRVVPEYRDKFCFTHLMVSNFAETYIMSLALIFHPCALISEHRCTCIYFWQYMHFINSGGWTGARQKYTHYRWVQGDKNCPRFTHAISLRYLFHAYKRLFYCHCIVQILE